MAQTEFMSKVSRVNTAKLSIKEALIDKGLEVGDNIEDYSTLIEQISGEMKVFTSETDMNNAIDEIAENEIVKLVKNQTTTYYMKKYFETEQDYFMVMLIGDDETITPAEYLTDLGLANDILGGQSVDVGFDLNTYRFGNSNFSTLPAEVVNSNWTEVVDVSYVFQHCNNLTTIPLLDLSNIEVLSFAFDGCPLQSLPADLDTHNVEDFTYTFCGNEFTTIPLLDTSKGLYMERNVQLL